MKFIALKIRVSLSTFSLASQQASTGLLVFKIPAWLEFNYAQMLNCYCYHLTHIV